MILGHADVNGKIAVFIGGGGLSKEPHYRALSAWGLRTVIVRSPADAISDDCAELILSFEPLDEHVNDERNALSIADLIRQHGINPDCVLTLWEDCGPLAARVAQVFGLRGIAPDAATVAKSKLQTQSRLSASPNQEIASLAVQSVSVESPQGLGPALSRTGLPAILKLEHGSSAAGVHVVTNVSDALDHWTSINSSLTQESDCPGVGLGFGTHVIVAERVVGTEHDVDIVLWEGSAIAAFVTDNGPTRLPRCAETTAIMPSTLDRQAQEALVRAAEMACQGLGIRSAVLNVEMIKTTHGIKVIDINARMGGFYIRDWILRLWNYDLLFASVCCALGVRPPVSGPPCGWIAGAMVLPSVHSNWVSREANRRRLFAHTRHQREIVNVFDEHVKVMAAVDEPFGNVAVWAETPGAAIQSLIKIWAEWGLMAHDPDFEKLLPTVFATV